MLWLIPLSHGVSCLLLRRHNSVTQWWLMHVICNVATCLMVYQDLSELAKGLPVAHPSDRQAVIFVVSMHVYHALMFPLSPDDRFHHVVFAFILGLPTVLFSCRASNAMLFFLSGFPGALIYTLLVFRRCSMLRSCNEPMFSCFVNVCIRSLGILLCNIRYGIDYFYDEKNEIPFSIFALQSGLSTFNAIYYTQQSIRRYLQKSS